MCGFNPGTWTGDRWMELPRLSGKAGSAMDEVVIEQAIWHRADGTGRRVAQSAGFLDDWQAEAERLAAGFGERPEGVTCPGAVFARPFGPQHVAVVQVADQGGATGRAGILGFHFLIIPRAAYTRLWGDPFALADRVPPAWHSRGLLPALSWPAEPLPPRTVAEVQRVLQRTKAAALVEDEEIPADWDRADVGDPALSEGPVLLGGVQVLVDGGRLVFERPAPDTGLVRGLWTLLPTGTRCQLWPASFAFGNALGFDAVIVPPAVARTLDLEGCTTEEQACDYPQGSYELNLQIAAEAGDQAGLDALLSRRSWAETWRLGIVLLAAFSILALALNLGRSPSKPGPAAQQAIKQRYRAAAAAAAVSAANPWGALAVLEGGKTTVWKKPVKELP
jgi:hypothetical protein